MPCIAASIGNVAFISLTAFCDISCVITGVPMSAHKMLIIHMTADPEFISTHTPLKISANTPRSYGHSQVRSLY
ncbi:hypothetical protein FPV67DRAFT_1486585 [Lyophyllum atratum]|nr:hypothetical protein FPV67DRAFT_1486585 [Lyophyllum atratum]